MTIRVRHIVVSVQVIVAAVMTISNRMRPDTAEIHAWTAPDRQFCDGLNAPASLIRVVFKAAAERIWYPLPYSVDFLFETIFYLFLVGLLWYTVTIEVSGHGRSLITSKFRFRRIADVFGIIFGLMLAILGFFVGGQFGAVTTYSSLVAVPYYAWATVTVFFYGHDLFVPQAVTSAGER